MHFKHSVTLSAEKRGERISFYVRLGVHSKRKKFATGYSVSVNEWDAKRQCVVGRDDADTINDNINEMLKSARKLFSRYELIEEREPTIDEVTDAFMTVLGKKTDETPKHHVADYVDMFIEEESKAKDWSESTRKKFVSLKNHWCAFDADSGQQFAFDDVNELLLTSFMDYLQNDCDFKNTTLQKYSGFVRWYLRWAHDKGLYDGDCHRTFRPTYKGSNGEYNTIIFLEQEELEALQNMTFKENQSRLERVRDIFMFACFCGLRFSDIAKLKKWQIHDDIIEVVTQKTTDHLYINMNDVTRAIYDKYKDDASLRDNALPVRTNQRTNEYLKELCKLAHIDKKIQLVQYQGAKRIEQTFEKWELITFHAARRTFITQAFRLGMPTEVIMKFSGHHSREMLKPYMKIVDEMKKMEMQKFNNFFMRPKCDQ